MLVIRPEGLLTLLHWLACWQHHLHFHRTSIELVNFPRRASFSWSFGEAECGGARLRGGGHTWVALGHQASLAYESELAPEWCCCWCMGGWELRRCNRESVWTTTEKVCVNECYNVVHHSCHIQSSVSFSTGLTTYFDCRLLQNMKHSSLAADRK